MYTLGTKTRNPRRPQNRVPFGGSYMFIVVLMGRGTAEPNGHAIDTKFVHFCFGSPSMRPTRISGIPRTPLYALYHKQYSGVARVATTARMTCRIGRGVGQGPTWRAIPRRFVTLCAFSAIACIVSSIKIHDTSNFVHSSSAQGKRHAQTGRNYTTQHTDQPYRVRSLCFHALWLHPHAQFTSTNMFTYVAVLKSARKGTGMAEWTRGGKPAQPARSRVRQRLLDSVRFAT